LRYRDARVDAIISIKKLSKTYASGFRALWDVEVPRRTPSSVNEHAVELQTRSACATRCT